MSATPEQIAVELDDLANQLRTGTDNGWGYIDDLRVAAALIRAQSEREKVLVEALKDQLSWMNLWFDDIESGVRPYLDGFERAEEKVRAALAGAP